DYYCWLYYSGTWVF
nr:immunoglobulin light chain junction region [Macaca mulatta]